MDYRTVTVVMEEAAHQLQQDGENCIKTTAVYESTNRGVTDERYDGLSPLAAEMHGNNQFLVFSHLILL